MIPIENLNILRKHFRPLLEKVKQQKEEEEYAGYHVSRAKSGSYTISIQEQDKLIYLHSRYHPMHEAECFVRQYEEETVRSYKYILFYGVGFGYHIEVFARRFPDSQLILYEPSAETFKQYMIYGSLKKMPVKQIKQWFIEEEAGDIDDFLASFIDELKTGRVMLVTLPMYKRLFRQQYDSFLARFTSFLQDVHFSATVTASFEKLWTINSFMNLPETLHTNSIFAKREYFSGKPALIVAAGPSLEDELEHLRYIKENGLAYIFCVGSAIHTLLAHGIYPDAVCVYDPKSSTKWTVQPIVEQNIDIIPLIYGTSVGFETVCHYPGPKLHMVTSQDTVSSFFLKRTDDQPLDIVQDAPSIAVIALQMAMKLGCQPICLVGQNLAYRGTRYYAGAIPYYTPDMTEEQRKEAFPVRDVYGNEIYTNEGFNWMRLEMEKCIEVINTTRGGAHIEGTSFSLLGEVMVQRFTEPVVSESWCMLSKSSGYDVTYAGEKMAEMKQAYGEIIELFSDLVRVFQSMGKHVQQRKETAVQKDFGKVDKVLGQIKKNAFFEVFLLPMNQVSYDFFAHQLTDLRFANKALGKAEKVMREFSMFIQICQEDMKRFLPFFNF